MGLHSKSTDEVRPPQYPERYHALALAALRKGDVSMGRFAQMLEIGIWDAMQLDQKDAPGADLSLVAAWREIVIALRSLGKSFNEERRRKGSTERPVGGARPWKGQQIRNVGATLMTLASAQETG